MAAVAGYKGAVYFGAQASTTFTNEAMTEQNSDNLTFVITDATKSMWDDTATFTVQKDTAGNGTFVTQDPTAYTIDHAIGRVRFATAIGATDVVRVSGKYFTKTQVARAKEWSLDVERNLEADTEFGSAWETLIPVLGRGSGSITVNWSDAAWRDQMFATAPRIVLALYTDFDNNRRYEMGALIESDAITAGVSGLVEEELSFTSTGRVFYT